MNSCGMTFAFTDSTCGFSSSTVEFRAIPQTFSGSTNASGAHFTRVLLPSDSTLGSPGNSFVLCLCVQICRVLRETVRVWHSSRFLTHLDPPQVPGTRRTHLSGCDAGVENSPRNVWPLFMERITYHCNTLTLFKPTASCHNIYPTMNLALNSSTLPFKRTPFIFFICVVRQELSISLGGGGYLTDIGNYVTGKRNHTWFPSVLRLWVIPRQIFNGSPF